VGQEQIDGAELVGLPKNSAWRRLGFQSGDVILNVNGRKLKNRGDLDEALEGLQKDQKTSIDIKVIRGNQEMLLNYQLSW
jgi:S1-C subfamily serine protease